MFSDLLCFFSEYRHESVLVAQSENRAENSARSNRLCDYPGSSIHRRSSSFVLGLGRGHGEWSIYCRYRLHCVEQEVWEGTVIQATIEWRIWRRNYP